MPTPSAPVTLPTPKAGTHPTTPLTTRTRRHRYFTPPHHEIVRILTLIDALDCRGGGQKLPNERDADSDQDRDYIRLLIAEHPAPNPCSIPLEVPYNSRLTYVFVSCMHNPRIKSCFPFTDHVLYLCPVTGGNRLEVVLIYTMLFSSDAFLPRALCGVLAPVVRVARGAHAS